MCEYLATLMRDGEDGSHTSSWYLRVFQSCSMSMSCVFSSSLSGIFCRMVDVGQPNSPAGKMHMTPQGLLSSVALSSQSL